MTSALHEPSGCAHKSPNTPAGGEVKAPMPFEAKGDFSAHPRGSGQSLSSQNMRKRFSEYGKCFSLSCERGANNA